MKHTPTIYIIILSVLMFVPFISITSAHVPFGTYAGTHAVAFVPEPGSPFSGETVEMSFFFRDLQGNFPTEVFNVEIVIQETFSDESEQNIAKLVPNRKSPGIYTTGYRFDREGHYRVEFLFNKIDEPEIIRDAVFDLEVRNIPSRDVPYLTIAVLSIFAVLVSFFAGIAFARIRKAVL